MLSKLSFLFQNKVLPLEFKAVMMIHDDVKLKAKWLWMTSGKMFCVLNRNLWNRNMIGGGGGGDSVENVQNQIHLRFHHMELNNWEDSSSDWTDVTEWAQVSSRHGSPHTSRFSLALVARSNAGVASLSSCFFFHAMSCSPVPDRAAFWFTSETTFGPRTHGQLRKESKTKGRTWKLSL